jgi:hypothetical protein
MHDFLINNVKLNFLLDFRGYTLRKQKFTPEMEAKIRIILNTAESRNEAIRLLQREKFHHEDIVRIIQKYYR